MDHEEESRPLLAESREQTAEEDWAEQETYLG